MDRMKALENGETMEAYCKSTTDADVEDVLGLVTETA